MENEDDKELEAEMENMPTSDRKIMRQVVNRFKGMASGTKRTANQAALAAKAGLMMAKLTRYSQDAMKCYWDTPSNTPKKNPDFVQALELNGRGLKICDEIMAAWPAQMSSIMPLKEKIMAQRRDIELQKTGKIEDPDVLIAQAKAPAPIGETHA